MSKFNPAFNFQNIAKGIVTKKQSCQPYQYPSTLNPNANSIKPQLQWLRNYLRPITCKAEIQKQATIENQKPNLSKKCTTRRLMKTRQRMTITNDNKENKNMMNNILQPRFGILSNKTIVSKVQDSCLLDIDSHNRRNSCQLFRNTKKQGKFRNNRQYFAKVKKSKEIICGNALNETLQPWEMQQLRADFAQPDIVGYMFSRQL